MMEFSMKTRHLRQSWFKVTRDEIDAHFRIYSLFIGSTVRAEKNAEFATVVVPLFSHITLNRQLSCQTVKTTADARRIMESSSFMLVYVSIWTNDHIIPFAPRNNLIVAPYTYVQRVLRSDPNMKRHDIASFFNMIFGAPTTDQGLSYGLGVPKLNRHVQDFFHTFVLFLNRYDVLKQPWQYRLE